MDIQKHVTGWLGILVVIGLIAVSAFMNWRFGYSLGRTEIDGQVYGAASVCADIFKALIPFFFFGAIHNKQWGHAFASAVIWTVVTAFSMTSAIGHSALNRTQTAGHRTAEAASYKDLRDDLKRTKDSLSWLPPHRGEAAVLADMNGLKASRLWSLTNECNEASIAGKAQREFCQGYQKLSSELGNARDQSKYDARISEIETRLKLVAGQAGDGDADPQAFALTRIANAIGFAWIKVPETQTALSLFVALLIEIGSNLGLYVAAGHLRKGRHAIIDLEADKPAPTTAPAVATGKPTPLLAVASAPLALTGPTQGAVPALPPPLAPDVGLGDGRPLPTAQRGEGKVAAAATTAPRNPFLRKPAAGSEPELRSIRFPVDGRAPGEQRNKLPLKDAAENFVRGLQAFGLTDKELWYDEPHAEAVSQLSMRDLYRDWSAAYHTEMCSELDILETLKRMKTKGIEYKERVRIDPDKRDGLRRNCFIVAGRRYPKAEEKPAEAPPAPPGGGAESKRPFTPSSVAANDAAPLTAQAAVRPRLAVVPTRSWVPEHERWALANEAAEVRRLKAEANGSRNRKQRGSRTYRRAA